MGSLWQGTRSRPDAANALLTAVGSAILQGIGAKPEDQLRPQILYHDIIEDLSDQHAVILSRSRDASIRVPEVALLILPRPARST